MRQDQHPDYDPDYRNPDYRAGRWSKRREAYRPGQDYERRSFEEPHGGYAGEQGWNGPAYRSPNFDARQEDRAAWEQRYRFGEFDDQRFHNEDSEHRVPRDETSRLIASTKVEGTPVFNPRGDRIGTIENFMVTKRSGRVEYAVLSFGGFMGLGERYYPLDWDELTYDENLGGYVVQLSREEISQRPSRADRWAFI